MIIKSRANTMHSLLKVLLITCVTFLAACGQKGALYFPSEQTTPSNSPEQTN